MMIFQGENKKLRDDNELCMEQWKDTFTFSGTSLVSHTPTSLVTADL